MGRKDNRAVVLIMGATGTGKSTVGDEDTNPYQPYILAIQFIKHVTDTADVHIGHKVDSDTFNVDTYVYEDMSNASAPVMLVDTPGFDDSREGITDTDILEKIANFLQNVGQRINGIIYMYRISDVRMGGMSRRNLKMFKELCGDDRLGNVRIVSTNWDRVDIKEGEEREADLAQGPFKPLIDAGAKMARQDNGRPSALLIMHELNRQKPVTLKITEEMSRGLALGDTSAGRLIVEEMVRLQKKNEEEMMELRREMEEAEASKKNELSAELAAEWKVLEEKTRRAESDKRKLQEMRIASLEREVELNRVEGPGGPITIEQNGKPTKSKKPKSFKKRVASALKRTGAITGHKKNSADVAGESSANGLNGGSAPKRGSNKKSSLPDKRTNGAPSSHVTIDPKATSPSAPPLVVSSPSSSSTTGTSSPKFPLRFISTFMGSRKAQTPNPNLKSPAADPVATPASHALAEQDINQPYDVSFGPFVHSDMTLNVTGLEVLKTVLALIGWPEAYQPVSARPKELHPGYFIARFPTKGMADYFVKSLNECDKDGVHLLKAELVLPEEKTIPST